MRRLLPSTYDGSKNQEPRTKFQKHLVLGVWNLVLGSWFLVLGIWFLFFGSSAAAQTQLPPSLRGVGFDQRLDEPLPLDATFHDEAGNSVRLGDYFSDKPVILVLIQFRCAMLCNEVVNGLVRTMLDIPLSAR